MTKTKENLIVVIASLFFTFVIILFINSTNLTTDVLWKTNDKQEVKEDVNILFQSWFLNIISQKNIDNIASISFEIMFDPSKIKLSRDDFDSFFEFSLTEKEWSNWYDVILSNINTLKEWDYMFKLKNITKEQFDNINVWHIQVIDNNWNILDLISSR